MTSTTRRYRAGYLEIGWAAPPTCRTRSRDLNRALADGMEIGTHFNGHFCASAGLPSGGDSDDTRLGRRAQPVLPPRARLPDRTTRPAVGAKARAEDITGDRTPPRGQAVMLYPRLAGHGFRYDSSFTRSP